MAIRRDDNKYTRLSLQQYDGQARDGEIVIDLDTYTVWVGDSSGALLPVSGGGGNGVAGGPTNSVQYNAGSGSFGGSANLTFDGTTLVTTNITVNGPTNLGNVGNVRISGGNPGEVLTTDGTGNLNWAPGGGSGGGQVFVTSNVVSLVAGQPLLVAADFANLTYPGGVFTIYQPAGAPSLTMTDQWASGGTSKAAFFANSAVNTQNILVTLAATNTSFNVQASDTITIGPSTVTGANLTGLGISGTGGTYTIPSTFFAPSVQTAGSTAVSASLTTAAGVLTATGSTLTTVAGAAFNFTSTTGAFASTNVPYFSAIQAVNWVTNGVVGTVTGGNVEVRQGATVITTLTTTGAVSGTSATINSALSGLTIVATYTGTPVGGGSPTTVGPKTSTLTTATSYQPLFRKITNSAANPGFTTSDSFIPSQFVPGPTQGGTTSATTSNYLWLAIPTASVQPQFKFDQPPFIGITVTADATFTNVNISGVTYNLYGFTNFSQAVFLYTTP
jgi:hypothetical protein